MIKELQIVPQQQLRQHTHLRYVLIGYAMIKELQTVPSAVAQATHTSGTSS